MWQPDTVLKFWLLALALCVLAGAAQSQGLPTPLADQYGVPVTVDPEAVQVAIVVTAKRLRRLKAWERALAKHYPEVAVVRIADVPRTAPTEREAVAEKLRRRLPPEVNVGIDLEGEWAQQLDLDVSRPTVLVFSGTTLVGRHWGMYHDKLFAGVARDLETALGRAEGLE